VYSLTTGCTTGCTAVFCIVSCLCLCLRCCVTTLVLLPYFRWIKIYIKCKLTLTPHPPAAAENIELLYSPNYVNCPHPHLPKRELDRFSCFCVQSAESHSSGWFTRYLRLVHSRQAKRTELNSTEQVDPVTPGVIGQSHQRQEADWLQFARTRVQFGSFSANERFLCTRLNVQRRAHL